MRAGVCGGVMGFVVDVFIGRPIADSMLLLVMNERILHMYACGCTTEYTCLACEKTTMHAQKRSMTKAKGEA